MRRFNIGWVTGILFILFTSGCAKGGAPEVVSHPASRPAGGVKNIILLIGDGMGPQAIGLLNAYAKYGTGVIYEKERKTALESLIADGVLGMVHHEASGALTTDSAASATQFASGHRALPETLGIDAEGAPVETFIDRARALGKATGLVSDTRLTHATPAAFVAHQPSRSMEDEIAAEMVERGADVMLSGGLRYFIPQNASMDSELQDRMRSILGDTGENPSKRTDDRNLLIEAEAEGYGVVFDRGELATASGEKLLGLFALSGFPYRIDFNVSDPERTLPTLAEMTQKALDVLSGDENGFFLMVESGIIDWAEHDNDAGALLHEMIRFDETLRTLHAFVKARSDTLFIVTADHETGGFSFSYSRKDIPAPRRFPGRAFEDTEYAPGYNYGLPDTVDKLFMQKRSLSAIVDAFDALDVSEREGTAGATSFRRLVNEGSEFKISLSEAVKALAVEPNHFRVPGHSELDCETFPNVDDFEPFYVYVSSVRRSNIGRVLADHQNVVWSTGTHTNTPVPIIAVGPPHLAQRFGRLMHTTEWARTALEMLE